MARLIGRAFVLLAVLTWFRVPCVLAAENLLSLQNMDDDAEEEIVLENSFFRLVLKPSAGGQAISLKPKPSNTEMVVGGGRFMMSPAVWQQGGGDFGAPKSPPRGDLRHIGGGN